MGASRALWPTGHYQIEKWFHDYSENIEAVNIHYACTPLGGVPDWNSQRATRFLPVVEPRLRRKAVKLPSRILDMSSGQLTDCYLLHRYFQRFLPIVTPFIHRCTKRSARVQVLSRLPATAPRFRC
jgi:hypothetical protein